MNAASAAGRAVIFGSPSPDGIALVRELAIAAQATGLDPVLAPADATQRDLERAILGETAVLIDGTVEPENGNFRIASSLIAAARHVLLVGRSPLPVNFVSMRGGGAPDYPFDDPGSWTLAHIAAWARENLADIAANPDDRFGDAEGNLLLAQAGRAFRALRAQQERPEPHRVFVSYRGPEYEAVRALADRDPELLVIRPGALALEHELMSEARRWLVVGLLEDELRACRELRIHHRRAAAAPYLGSWWTVAELLAAAYIRSRSDLPLVRVRDAETGALSEDPRYALAMPEELQWRMIRLMSHTRPWAMAPEVRGEYLARRERYQRPLSSLLLHVTDTWQSWTAGAAMLLATRSLAGWRDRPRDSMRDYAFDHVHDDSFWFDLCIEESRLTGERVEYPLDAGRILSEPAERMIRFSREEAARAAAEGSAIRSIDGRKWPVRVAERPPRWLWHPARRKAPGSLEPVPAFVVEQ